MGQVHQLILEHGLEQAKSLSSDKLDRQCVDAAFAIMSDEDQKIGIMHAGFSMTALPHKNIRETTWIKEGGQIRLRVESGYDAEGNPVGIPYGSFGRMILLYLQTQAFKTKSRDVELGKNMSQWLRSMGVEIGGKSYALVREQARRISLCRLTFYRITEEATTITNGSFVRNAIMPTKDDAQLQLWQDTVRLDEGYYQNLINHPMPVREAAIREIAHKSMAIDVYVWLAYRLHVLAKPTTVSWQAIFKQFGGGFQHIRQFKPKFREVMTLALAVYPEARVADDENGLILYPSPSPVPDGRVRSLNLVK